MPFHWTINPTQRVMFLRSSGIVTRAEVEELIDAIVDGGALAYDKLFDGSAARTSMTAEEMLDLGMRFRAIHSVAAVGALAVVMPVDRGDQMERMMGMIAAADRPMRVFTDLEKARAWLEKQIGRPVTSLA
jgi:hypothetical protein